MTVTANKEGAIQLDSGRQNTSAFFDQTFGEKQTGLYNEFNQSFIITFILIALIVKGTHIETP